MKLFFENIVITIDSQKAETTDTASQTADIKTPETTENIQRIFSLKRKIKHCRQRKAFYKEKYAEIKNRLEKIESEKNNEIYHLRKQFDELNKEFNESESCDFCYGPYYHPKTAKLNCGCIACLNCFLDRKDRLDNGRCNGCLVDITGSLRGSIYRD